MLDSASESARLLLVAHGTASSAGRATLEDLAAAVATARPGVPVELCYLDVIAPRLPAALARLDTSPTVLVPLLLSTGYHVRDDIPATIAGRTHVRAAGHLGPDPLVVAALADRLGPVPNGTAAALVASGSSHAAAAAEVATAGRRLAELLARPVTTHTVGAELGAELHRLPGPVRIATYLLAEGRFLDTLRDAAAGIAPVPAPLGAHPAVVELVWRRYDEVVEPVR